MIEIDAIEFAKVLGDKVTTITNDKKTEGITLSEDGLTANIYNIVAVGDESFGFPKSLITADLTGFDASNLYSTYNMFQGCSSLTSVDLFNWNISGNANMSYMFQGCSSLTSIDLSNWNISRVFDMSYMFQGCSSLTSIDLSNIKNSLGHIDNVFSGCKSLKELNLSNLIIDEEPILVYSLFDGLSDTTVYISNKWNFSKKASDYVGFSGRFAYKTDKLYIKNKRIAQYSDIENALAGLSISVEANVLKLTNGIYTWTLKANP